MSEETMSKFRSIPYAVLSGSLLVGGSAYAQSMYSIDQRQDYQQNRIEQGIQSGQITRSEAYRLEQGERAIDRAQARARADGVVTQQERARIDRMVDREGREIYRQSHDSQQAWDRGQSWGRTDGRYDGWRDRYTQAGRDGGRDGWGNHGGGDRGWGDRGDQGRHYGWNQGQHNGWDGNRPAGIERRDAWNDHRIANGTRDGSLTPHEANRLDRGQNRVDRYEARARSDGQVTPYERGRINQMQNDQSRSIYQARHNDRTATTAPATGTQQPTHNWGNGGWQRQQASMPQAPRPTQPTQPQQAPRPAPQQPQYNGGNGGWRMQQASATPAQQPTFQRAAAPTGGAPRTRSR
jgi:hypothetical protein